MKKILIVLGVVLMVLSNNAAFANEFDAEGRIIAKYGSPIIDGQIDEVWKQPMYIHQNMSVETSVLKPASGYCGMTMLSMYWQRLKINNYLPNLILPTCRIQWKSSWMKTMIKQGVWSDDVSTG